MDVMDVCLTYAELVESGAYLEFWSVLLLRYGVARLPSKFSRHTNFGIFYNLEHDLQFKHSLTNSKSLASCIAHLLSQVTLTL